MKAKAHAPIGGGQITHLTGCDSYKEDVWDADAEEFLMERFVARASNKFAQLDEDKRGVLVVS